MQGRVTSLFLVSIFLISFLSPLSYASNPTREVDVEIYLEPNGLSDDYSIEVPVGEIVSELEFDVLEQPHPINEVITLSKKSDWANGAMLDGVDYNQTGLRVLPNSYEWDFEGSAQGWTFSGSAWNHGYDTSLGQNSGVHSGSSAIYTYNGNYPNYMGGPYWATSPTIDCSACSGTWDFKYWKRLGVESRSYDRAYVQVTNSNSGWVTVYQNPYGSVNDNSFSQSSHDVSSYINGNSAFQVRFGLGSSDGSITYTGWNVDDVTLEPRTNAGTGSANWTSNPFGPQETGSMKTHHGMMSIDAEIPSGATMQWSLIDADEGTEIPGFTNRIDFNADLAAIDVEEHPRLQIKIFMTSTAESPIIHKIKFGGGLIQSFENGDGGWSGYSTITNGLASGVDSLKSPEWRVSYPFSQVNFQSTISGSGTLEACFTKINDCNASSWTPVPQNGILYLQEPSVYLNVRWNGSGSYSFDHFEADLLRHSSPSNVQIDIGMDGISEWSMDRVGFGNWGHQNEMIDSNQSKLVTIGTSMNKAFEFFYPHSSSATTEYKSLGNLQFYITPKNQPLGNLEIEFYSNNNFIVSKSVGSLAEPTKIILSDSEMSSLELDLSSKTPDSTMNGLDLHRIEVRFSNSAQSELIVSGLSIPYEYKARIAGESAAPIISAINSQLGLISASSGFKLVKIPIVIENTASLRILEYKVETTGTPIPVSMTILNETDTLVAGEDWYEFTSVFDLSALGVSDAETYFNDEGWESKFTLSGNNWVRSMECSLSIRVCNSQQGIIFGSFDFSFDQSLVEFYHKVKISTIWPNEEGLVAYSAIIMQDIDSQPTQYRLGLGNSMGVERDITVVDWGLSFENGSRNSILDAYIDPSNECTIEVELVFDNLSSHPRSGVLNIGLLVDGNVVDTTQDLSDGVASLSFTPNPLAVKIEIAISVAGLYDQKITWNTAKNATFIVDTISPVIISSNVAKFDHRPTSEPLDLQFQIGDRPVLPRHAYLHLEVDGGEHKILELDKPANLNGFQGYYSKIIDVSDYSQGDILAGWLDVIDPAGHSLIDSGTRENPLFIIKFGPDGPPIISQDGLDWTQEDYWLHPGQNYGLQIPMSDINGYGDIEAVSVDLGFGTDNDLTLQWSTIDGCSSQSETVNIVGCEILGNASYFDPLFVLEMTFELSWEFNPDTSVIRTVMVEVQDDAGQSYSQEMSRKWRYSSEMEVDFESVIFQYDNSYVAPGKPTKLFADVVWSKGGQPIFEPIEISAAYSDYVFYGVSDNGSAEIEILASNYSGIYPLTIDLVNLPVGAIDRTQDEKVVAWIVVDGNQPFVSSLISPNPFEQVQERDWKQLQFELLVNEPEGLQIDSVKLHWLIVPRGINLPEYALLGGNLSMSVIAGTGAGNSIPLATTIDMDAIIPEVSRENSWDLWIWVTGEDLSGQSISHTFNNKSTPLAKLELASRKSELILDSDSVILSNENPIVDNPVWINVTVENIGHVDGITSLRVEVVESGDQRRLIEIISLSVGANSSESIDVKWVPGSAGAAWIEISTPDGKFVRTSPIQVEEDSSVFVIEGLEGANSAMLTGFGVIIFGMLGLLGYLVISGRQQDEVVFDESEFI